jgi:hypothetical protein
MASAEQDDEAAAEKLATWMSSSLCSYEGVRDRLLIGHRVLGLCEGRCGGDQRPGAARSKEHRHHRNEQKQRELEDRRQRQLEQEQEQEQIRQRLEARARVAEACVAEAEARLEQAVRQERERASELARQDRERVAQVSREQRDRDTEALGRERERMASQHADLLARGAAEHAAMMHRVADVGELRSRQEARDAELREQLVRLGSSIHSAEVQRLRSEVERLRGTNHVKGTLGEAAVAAALRSDASFEAWAFADTSARGSESDFHLTSPAGETLVVEVKNKATVSAADVSKSLRDAAELTDRLGPAMLGYLFVSVRSRAIPGKGALHLEVTPRGVPVLWCGVDAPLPHSAEFPDGQMQTQDPQPLLDESRSRDVVRAARLLADVGRALAARRAAVPSVPAGDSAAEASAREALAFAKAERAEVVRRLNDQLVRVDAMRHLALRLADSVSATRRNVAALQSAIDGAFKELEAYAFETGGIGIGVGIGVGVGIGIPTLPVSASSSDQQEHGPHVVHTCTECLRTFASAGGLLTHSRVHSKPKC